MRPHGRARVSSTNPEAFATCDRCGLFYNLNDLQYQWEWSAQRLYNKGMLFCETCLDKPQEQLRTIILPPDPMPVLNARTEPFAYDNDGPVTSQIAVAAEQGDTIVFVEDVTGFEVGQTVYVQLNNATFAAEEVQAVNTLANSLTLSIPLPYAASTLGIVTTANS